MLTAAWRVGRLVELRLAGNPTLEDAARFEVDSRRVVAACVAKTKARTIVCSDLRASQIWRPEVTEQLVSLMRRENNHVERHGSLGSGSALVGLQVSRLLKEASADGRRRVFTQPEPLLFWLDEVLTEPERKRVREFLAEVDSEGVRAPLGVHLTSRSESAGKSRAQGN